MSEERMDPGEGLGGPEIQLSAEPTQVERGQPVTLDWHVEGAEQVVLWINTSAPAAPEPLNWATIAERGEPVRSEGHTEQIPEATTAFHLVATGPLGMSGRRVIVEVLSEIEPRPEPQTWSPQKQFLPQMEDRSHVAWAGPTDREALIIPVDQLVLHLGSGQAWYSGPTPPGISLSANPQVIFEDESAILSWKVFNANCATSGYSVRSTDLVPDKTHVSGTKHKSSSWGSGGIPHCGLTMKGSKKVLGQTYGHSHQEHGIIASNALAKSASASRWLDVLSVPQFKGAATQSRKSGIRAALKVIDAKLRNGAVYNDSSLDTKVAAFKNGHLDRKAFWATLLIQLQNIGLVTFNCKNVSDQAWAAGGWTGYTNEIRLEWSPSYTPWLAYVIAHELMHKCGFNDVLKNKYGYSVKQIEIQCHTVSKACFP